MLLPESPRRRSHKVRLPLQGKPAGILRVPAVGHVAHRFPLAARAVEQAHLLRRFNIDIRDLLARTEIGKGLVALLGGHTECDAAARAALVEPEHETGMLKRAAMMEGIDAERPVRADQRRRRPLAEGKARLPHQRAVAEHPKLSHEP